MPSDPRLIALLPTVGLCSCVVATELAPEIAAPGLIERASEREPPTVAQAMIRSGRESLAAGHYAAAYASLSLAAELYPNESMLVTMDTLDAALGMGDAIASQRLIDEIRHKSPTLQPLLQTRVVRLREIENGRGDGPCEAHIDETARPLRRTSDALAAWNQLRSGLPADHAIPIPSDEDEAWQALCSSGCTIGEPSFARLEGDNQTSFALIVPHEDGGFSVLPDLLRAEMSECYDQTLLATERHDGLLRVRAFVDRRDRLDPADWALREAASSGYASSGSSHAYAYASSGYNPAYASSGANSYSSHGYAYASSGYSYAYASSGYHYTYHCGGGYDYAYCEASAHLERDLILDLDRGEIVLDIVRTGERGSALGRVTMDHAAEGSIVDVQACGQSRRLQLHYT
jgi:hypothetical protein